MQIHVHIPLIYAHEILGQCDIYFWNGNHFNKILNVAFLSTWLSLELLYLVQLCIYTGATHRKKIMHLQIIFLKLWILKKNYILHFLAHIHAKDTNPHPHLSLCTWWHTAGASGVYSFYIHWKYVFVNPSQLKGIWAQKTSIIIYLAHLVMSLCNHALSGKCCWHHLHLCLHLHHLCTAVPVTALIIDFISYKYMHIFS